MKLPFLFFVCSSLLFASSMETLHSAKANANAQAVSTQKHINTYSDENQKLYDEYLRVSQNLSEQQTYNKQLNGVVDSLHVELPLLENQLQEIDTTHKKILPHMLNMIDTLEKFIALDLPFLLEQRTRRVNSLKALMKRSDVSMAEQYRSIIEAYKIENEYAKSIESYRSEVMIEDKEAIVDFLRMGRLSLYYQSLDRKHSGMFDKKTRKFIVLDESYNSMVKKGIKMAKKKIAPELLTLPLKRGE